MISKIVTADSDALVGLYALISPHIERVERVIQDELFSPHPFVSELCERVGRYRGKMLRPALVLLSGEAVGGVNDDHHTLAAVVEIVHLATLVHDDVLDDADRRRRHPTINATHGNVTAVLMGDFLISHAYHLCGSLGDQYAARTIGATTNTVCEGELIEIHHRHDAAISEEAYFDIIRGKTASLTGTCCALGARYAGADADTVGTMRDFGLAAGTAFQIVDDVLDLTGTEVSTGKSLGLDLAHGSATLPIIHCLLNASPGARADLAAFVRAQPTSDSLDIRSLLDDTGSIDYAFDVARRYVDTATDRLRALPDTPARDSLRSMAEFILSRQF